MKRIIQIDSKNRQLRKQRRAPFTAAAVSSVALLLAACGGREEQEVTAYDTTTTDTQAVESPYAASGSTDATATGTTTATTGATASGTAGTDRMAMTDTQRASSNPDSQQSSPGGSQQANERDSATVTLQEEELDVEKRQEQAGGVLVKTDVVTEEVQQPIELRREEVDVVQLSEEEARRIQEDGGQQFEEDEVFIPLTREKAVVNKDVETTGGVRVTTNEQTEQQNVDATLRREVVDVQRQGAAQEGQQENQGSSYASTQSGQDTQGLEQRIRQDLRSAQDLSLNEEQINQIEIQVQGDNTIVLSGTVPSEDISQQIEQRISDMDGVESVENELQAQGQTQAAE